MGRSNPSAPQLSREVPQSLGLMHHSAGLHFLTENPAQAGRLGPDEMRHLCHGL
jgi:hypothetical protein